MSASHKILKSIAVISIGLFSVLTVSGCSSNAVENEIVKPITGETKLSYTTAVADIMTIENEDKIPANLAFGTTKTYNAPFDGKIKVLNVSKNQMVKKGDILIALDTTDLDFKINEQRIKIETMSDSIERGYAQIELDKMIEQRDNAVVTAEYDGVVNQCAYTQIGNNIKAGSMLCTVSVPETIFVYNSEGAGANLRFGMDVDLKINNVEYKGTVCAAPDTAPEDASSSAKKYCAVQLTDNDKERLLTENDGISAVDAGWATIFAITTRRVNVLAVPSSAVKTSGTKNYCSILQGEEKYDMPVEIGAVAGGYTEIVSGLNKGDVVILAEPSTSNKPNNNNK